MRGFGIIGRMQKMQLPFTSSTTDSNHKATVYISQFNRILNIYNITILKTEPNKSIKKGKQTEH